MGGWGNFIELFSGGSSHSARNTVAMAILNLTLGFVAGPILGLLIGQLRGKRLEGGTDCQTTCPTSYRRVVCCS